MAEPGRPPRTSETRLATATRNYREVRDPRSAIRTLETMEREPVRSSTLATVGYNEDTKSLEIEFRSGAVYRYDNVPLALYIALVEGNKPGRFFSLHIRDAFDWEAIDPSRPAGPAYFGSSSS